MDRQEEYHDPDYPTTSGYVKKQSETITEEEKVEKIKSVIRREFTNELEIREDEVMQIDQRMLSTRRLLNRLRYALVSSYFRDQKLQLTNSQIQDEIASQHEPRARSEVSAVLRDSQRRIHPSVRKLLGKQAVDLDEILFRNRAPRTKARKDYCAMVQARNYTIAADTTKSLRPGKTVEEDQEKSEPGSSRPKKVPRHLQPKIVSVVTLDEATRNQMKHRYRIIIGNTSKYAPAASQADRSTHKWLLYVRGPPHAPDVSPLLTALRVRLHHSYAPHHQVHIVKPPFHISRRGWGEFPAKLELHFALPERNRPATVEHNIKLDRNYTGLQTLGAETIVDVWLYSTPEMLQYEFKENFDTDLPTDMDIDVPTKEQNIKQELLSEATEYESEVDKQTDNWLDFFSKDSTELDVDEMIIKPTKKIEERNDLESLIDENVIPKAIKEENHVDSQNEEFNELNDDSKCTDRIDNDETWIGRKNETDDLPNELLTQPTSLKKRIMKYMDPTTGKIYYLEMDRNLDLTKVQEIVINSKGNIKTAKISPIKSNGLKNVRKNTKKGVSLLKPEVKSLLKTENNIKQEKPKAVIKRSYTHIENDHCYLGNSWTKSVFVSDINSIPANDVLVKKEKVLYDSLCDVLSRFTSVRVAVNYLLKKIPVISGEARDPDFVKNFPFVVDTEERYWRMDFAKRRNIEWSRAKLINRMLHDHFSSQYEQIWRTKQILVYSRLHGFYPIRSETVQKPTENESDWSSWIGTHNYRKFESNIRDYYPNASDISTLTKFNVDDYQNCLSESLELLDSDEEIEIVNDLPIKVKREVMTDVSDSLTVLPVENEDDRLRFMFIERKCADIGFELRNEDVGSGYSYSAVHAVMLSAIKSFAEELVRSALAVRLREGTSRDTPPVWTGSSSRTLVSLEHIHGACGGHAAGLSPGDAGRLSALGAQALAALARSRGQHFTTL